MDRFYHLLSQNSLNCRHRHTVYRVNALRTRIPKQAQSRHAKAGVPDIHHVTRPVGDPPLLGVLTPQYEADEGVAVDPVRPADDLQAAQHPPAVADVLLLLGAAVEPAPGDLPLGEPAAQPVPAVGKDVVVQPARDGEGRNAGEDLARVRLGPGADAVAAVKVATGGDVVDRPVDISQVEEAEEGQGVEGAVEEARVLLAPLVAGEGACLPVLEAGYDCGCVSVVCAVCFIKTRRAMTNKQS